MPELSLITLALLGLFLMVLIFAAVLVLILRGTPKKEAEAISGSLRELERQLAQLAGASDAQGATVTKQLGEHRRELGDGMERLGERVRQLGGEQAKQQNDFRDLVDKKMTELRGENERKLDEMRKTVDEHLQSTLEKKLAENFKQVSERLEAVHRGLGEMQDMQKGVSDLKRVLTDVKARGTYGEVQLDALISDILTPDQYRAQLMLGDGQKVDFAIHMPGDDNGMMLPVDAKFPSEDYDRLLAAADAGDQAGVNDAGKKLEARVRQFAKDIAQKYIRPPETTDWAILFLPTEGLYAELLRRPGVFEALQRDYKVTLAGPTNLQVLLYTFRMGFRHAALSDQAREVWDVLGKVKGEFVKYGESIDKLGGVATSLQRRADELTTRRNVMLRALKSVEEGETLPGTEEGDSEAVGLFGPEH